MNGVLVSILAATVRRMNERLVEAFYVPAETRVLRRLHELATIYGETDVPSFR